MGEGVAAVPERPGTAPGWPGAVPLAGALPPLDGAAEPPAGGFTADTSPTWPVQKLVWPRPPAQLRLMWMWSVWGLTPS